MSSADLVERARALAPGIKARAAESEALRRPHDETIAELIDAGIVQMLVPKRWGGAETDLSTMYEVVETLGRADVSAAWIAVFYIGHNLFLTKFPETTQEEAFGARGFVLLPAATAPTMKATRVDGGWEVSGRAPWGSGVMHADWVMVSGTTTEGPRTFLMPAGDIIVDDTWRYSGMAGTGSNDMVADGVFVPDRRSVSGLELAGGVSEGTAIHANPLYSIPIVPMAYTMIAGVLAGGLAGALEAYEAVVARRVRNFSGAVVREQQHAHVTLGEMQIGVRAVQALARHQIERTEAIVAENRPFTVEERLYLKGNAAYLSKTARELVQQMMAGAGASSFHVDQPLQRYWRDLSMLTTHAFWDWDATRELVGRRHLGLPLNHPIV